MQAQPRPKRLSKSQKVKRPAVTRPEAVRKEASPKRAVGASAGPILPQTASCRHERSNLGIRGEPGCSYTAPSQ